MKFPKRLLRPSVLVVLLAMVAVSAFGFLVVRKDIEEMRRAGRENILWDVTQLEFELLRFQRVLAEFQVAGADVSPSEVNIRFDILWSRVTLFDQGNIGQRFQVYDQKTGTVAAIFQTMQETEGLIVDLAPGDIASARVVQAKFEPFLADLRQLSQTVLHGEEEVGATLREHLAQFSSMLAVLSATTVLVSLLFIYILTRDNARFRRLAATNRDLLEVANKANRAKSQFLAMMSHELRTPMNGVLGHLALIKQRGLSVHQDRLLGQAERSGHQMIGLLGDILDFADLQDDRLKLEKKPFDPGQLADAVSDMFKPVAEREGIVFNTQVSADCPSHIIGDFGRLRQALTHLATYILETAGTENITLEIGYGGGNLLLSICFDYDRSGAEWRPELITGEKESCDDAFASEALGPSVSRGLIERMGGFTKLDNPTANRIAVLVEVPAREIVVDRLLFRILARSASLEAICKASFQSKNVHFLAANDDRIPHVVMIEAGGETESRDVRDAAEKFPEAVLVAIGRPLNPDDFDDIVSVPIDLQRARSTSFMRLARGGDRLASDEKLRYPNEKQPKRDL